MNDPLDTLIVDAQAVDRERLAAFLSGKVGVDEKSGTPVLLEGFLELANARAKILTFLMARKAALLLGRNEVEGVGPTEISSSTGVPRGTVGRVLRELADARLLVQDNEGLYRIPSHQLAAAERVAANGV